MHLIPDTVELLTRVIHPHDATKQTHKTHTDHAKHTNTQTQPVIAAGTELQFCESLMTPNPIPTDRIMRVREVAAVRGLSTASVHRCGDRAQLEPPLKIGAQAVGWRESYVMAYIAGLQPVERT